jgi:hypothetical protein
MNTTHNSAMPDPDIAAAKPTLDLKKALARAFLAGGLGLAVLALGAGMANAAPPAPNIPVLPGPGGPPPIDPAPGLISRAPGVGAGQPLQPQDALSISPQTPRIFVGPFTATVAGVQPGATVSVFEDSASGPFLGSTNHDGPVPCTWVFTTYGHHTLVAQEFVGGQWHTATSPIFVDGRPDG